MTLDMTQLNAKDTVQSSFGLTPILNQLVSWSTTRNKPVWDTYVVNMLTMVRNNQQKGKSISKLTTDTINDIELLISYVERYVELDRLGVSEPKLVLYIPFYAIPQSYAKKIAPSILEQATVLDRIKHILKPKVYKQGELEVHVCWCGSVKVIPHIELVEYLHRIDTNCKFKRTVLITHIPLDLHISKRIVELKLFESFTGKVKPSGEFNVKVFGNTNIPFSKYIYLLFGDGVLLKRNVSKREHDQIVELAVKNKWKYRPEILIEKDILNLNTKDKKFFDDFTI